MYVYIGYLISQITICVNYLHNYQWIEYLQFSILNDNTKEYLQTKYSGQNINLHDTIDTIGNVARKPQYKDIYRRPIEIPQRARIFKPNCCLKVHNAKELGYTGEASFLISKFFDNAHLQSALPIWG